MLCRATHLIVLKLFHDFMHQISICNLQCTMYIYQLWLFLIVLWMLYAPSYIDKGFSFMDLCYSLLSSLTVIIIQNFLANFILLGFIFMRYGLLSIPRRVCMCILNCIIVDDVLLVLVCIYHTFINALDTLDYPN